MFSLMHMNIFLGAYVLPAVITYLLRRWYYKKYVPYELERMGGYFYGSRQPSGMDLFYIFFPIANVCCMFETGFCFLSHMNKIKNKQGKTFMQKFFKL